MIQLFLSFFLNFHCIIFFLWILTWSALFLQILISLFFSCEFWHDFFFLANFDLIYLFVSDFWSDLSLWIIILFSVTFFVENFFILYFASFILHCKSCSTWIKQSLMNILWILLRLLMKICLNQSDLDCLKTHLKFWLTDLMCLTWQMKLTNLIFSQIFCLSKLFTIQFYVSSVYSCFVFINFFVISIICCTVFWICSCLIYTSFWSRCCKMKSQHWDINFKLENIERMLTIFNQIFMTRIMWLLWQFKMKSSIKISILE